MVDCLAFSDKVELITRNPKYRELLQLGSGRAAQPLAKSIEALRNNLVHNQALTDADIKLVALLSEHTNQIVRAEGMKRILAYTSEQETPTEGRP